MEENAVWRYPHPVREIEIEQGVNEDGGGFKITVRLDGVDVEKVFEITLKLLEKVNGKGVRDREENFEIA